MNSGSKIQFNGETLTVHVHRYESNARLALQLRDFDNVPCGTATINLPSVSLADDEIIIKNYVGMLDALVQSGIVEDTGRNAQACAYSASFSERRIEFPIARLLILCQT